ncbi:MAG: thiamine diphosphokinase [Desulfobacteraceae bacterium]|nr:MAG: thiamine diphosphokinase [Desulfobacteraceae bacterium]
MRTCVIIASGSLDSPRTFLERISRADLVICADGGAGHLRGMGLIPDIIVGDLDSISDEDKAYFDRKQVRFVKHPEKKDATDTALAVDLAVEEGAADITLIGVSGTRMDHTLANVFLLKTLSDRHIACRMIDTHNEVYLVTDSLEVQGRPGDLLSIIPAAESARGVTIEGLEYPLENAQIPMGSSIGISNVFVGNQARINVESGVLIVFKSRD